MSENGSCADRIRSELDKTLEMLSPDCEQCQDGYCDEHIASQDVLSVEKKIFYDIQLSYGGPADFFRVFLTDSGRYMEIDRIEYHFQDWFDGASLTLDNSEQEQVESWIWSNLYLEELGM